MKVFEFKHNNNFRYPDDMKKILDYLNDIGKVNVSEKRIEQLYEEFSDDCYCAGWMGVNDNLLEHFANYISEIDI